MTQIAAAGPELSTSGYSTKLMPARSRLGYWNDLSSNLFGSVTIMPRCETPFEGEIVRYALPDCEIFSVRSSPVSVERVARAPTPHPPDLVALDVMCSGHGHINVGGRDMEIGAGDLLLLESSASNYFCFDVPTHVLVLLLPASRFGLQRHKASVHLNRCIHAESGGTAMLSRFLRDSWQDMQLELVGPRSSLLSDIMWNLVDLAFPIQESSDLPPTTQRHASLESARRLIERELCNPSFGVKDISEVLRVTPRYVQLLFNDLETTPTHYLLARRLERVAARLRSEPQTRITDLALEVGFNDVTYFSRAFHKRFKMTAREYRAAYSPKLV